MKHFTIKHLILSITIPASLAIVYGGSPAGNPQGTTWPSRPKCDSLITGDMVFTFHSINLGYSLDDYGDAVNPDLIELSNAHGINSANKSGSITMLSNIFLNTTGYTGDNAPSIQMKYSGVECTGHVEKKFTDMNGINANQITIPMIDNSLQVKDVHAEIKSIRTNFHQLQLLWSASVTINHLSNSFDDNADVTGNLVSITCQGPSANTLVVRSDEFGNYYPVDNTVLDLGNLDNISVDFSSMSEVDCPTLDKMIYIGGDLSEDFEWDKPITAPVEWNDTIQP